MGIMRSLDRQPVPELSPEAEAMRLRLRTALAKRVLRMESWMFEEREMQGREALPLFEERIKRIHAWLEGLALGEEGIPEEVDERVVGQTVEEYTRLLMALLDVREGRRLSGKARRYEYDLALGEFVLDSEYIPSWNTLPSEAEMQAVFALDYAWTDPNNIQTGYNQHRPLSDFALRRNDLERSGFSDPNKQRTLLEELEHREPEPVGRIFDISDAIKNKEKNKGLQPDEPAYQNYLTPQELFEAFEEAGVRPATLPELLAYSKNYWRPKENPNNSLTEQDRLQYANARGVCIYAVGALFSLANGRLVPCLVRVGNEYHLTAHIFGGGYDAKSRFLVFRRASL